jgi:diguanylate cyclase (GGDEF)-like protein/PAS domain S-box-containing protein
LGLLLLQKPPISSFRRPILRPPVLHSQVVRPPAVHAIDSHGLKRSLVHSLRRHSLALRLLGCFLGIAITTGFVWNVPEANRLVWVSNGVWLAYLLLAPRNRWVYYLAAGAAAQLVAGLIFDSQWQTTILLTCLNLGEVLFGALILRKRSSALPRFTNPAYLTRFLLIAVLVSPAIFGALYAAISHFSRHTSFSLILVQWLLADGLGMGVTAPACVAILRTSVKENLASLRYWPYLVLLGAVSAIAFALNVAPLSFIVYPLLVLILLRMGLAWAALGTLYTAGVSTWFLMHGQGPFAQLHFIPALGPGVALQLFVASVMFILYSVSVVLDSRQTAEKQLQEIASIHSMVTENSRDIILLTDFDGIPQYVSPAVETVTGWKPQEAMHRRFSDVIFPEDLPRMAEMIRASQQGSESAVFEYRLRKRDGGSVWVEGAMRAICDNRSGMRTGILQILRDITKRKGIEVELANAYRTVEEMAITDALTGLANRRRFDQCMQAEWRRGLRDRNPLSLLLIDADHFKAYNDSYGHLRGDGCLKQIAEAAQDIVARPGDLVARYGGEEFAVVLPNTANQGALQLATDICAIMQSRQLPHAGNPSGVVTVSIGCATLVPQFGQHADALIELADQALYRAKRSGRNQACNDSDLQGGDPAAMAPDQSILAKSMNA